MPVLTSPIAATALYYLALGLLVAGTLQARSGGALGIPLLIGGGALLVLTVALSGAGRRRPRQDPPSS